jgi:epoxyqueuosine reductase QueG
MNKETISAFLKDFLDKDTSNFISAGVTKKPECIGKRMFDAPIVCYASAEDDYLASLAGNQAANIDLLQPKEWLPEAKTVISAFMPFTEWLRAENRGGDWPAASWFYGRINGEVTMIRLVEALAAELRAAGHATVVPLTDPRLRIFMRPEGAAPPRFTSNWSERHVAFATGLGTFGISGGIITEKGMAGRLISLLTSLELEPTPRTYSGLLDHCILCGKCAQNCPGHAIDLASKKKDHILCNRYLARVRELEEPFYGCGKCSCDVPCEIRIPLPPR